MSETEGGGPHECTVGPVRVQLRRTKGWRVPPNTVRVARPGKWGNPHVVGWCAICAAEHTRAEAIAEYRAELDEVPTALLETLRGKNLACWCKPGDPCHADVLLELANAGPNAALNGGTTTQKEGG